MRPQALLVVLALGAMASAQGNRLHGKTHSQVLAMGQEKWMDFVSTKQGGSSTHGMAQALDFYSAAAQGRNDKLIAKLPKAHRDLLKSAHKALEGAARAVLIASRNSNGGGTMYTIFGAVRGCEIEDAFYSFLHRTRNSKFPPLVSGNAMREYRDLWKERLAKSESPEDKESLAKNIQEGDDAVAGALGAAADLDEVETRVLRALVADWLKPETEA